MSNLFQHVRHFRTRYVWARLTKGRHFEEVQAFCLFVGYPRSGHTLLGALLNAHRDAVISNEANAAMLVLRGCSRAELFGRILATDKFFQARKNVNDVYSYAVPNQWQGRFNSLRVIGDKRGGAVTRAIAAHPDFLDRTRALVGVPLRLIHAVRNPFDNIASISNLHGYTLSESAEFYFRHAETTLRLSETLGPDELVTIRHDDVIRDPKGVLSSLRVFLGLDCYPGYLEDCASIVFKAPKHRRRTYEWDPALVLDVAKRLRKYPYLADYTFDDRLNRPAELATPLTAR